MKLHEIMLYVNKPKVVGAFWEDVFGFQKSMKEVGGMLKVELHPQKESETTIVLFEKAIIRKVSPELNLATPSLLFAVERNELDQLYSKVKAAGVAVGDLVETPEGMRVFNFADPEGNFFAVRELGE